MRIWVLPDRLGDFANRLVIEFVSGLIVNASFIFRFALGASGVAVIKDGGKRAGRGGESGI